MSRRLKRMVTIMLVLLTFAGVSVVFATGMNMFAVNQTMTKAEFIDTLVEMTGVEEEQINGIATEGGESTDFESNLTREEAIVMTIRALGFDDLAQRLNAYGSEFIDVQDHGGYLTMALDFGIIEMSDTGEFFPKALLTREEAAVIISRTHDLLENSIETLHSYYAISSYDQMDMMSEMDSVSFGWSRLEYDQKTGDVVLNTTSSNNNEYRVPSGYAEPVSVAKENEITTQLMVFVKNDTIYDTGQDKNISLAEYILIHPEVRTQVIGDIVDQVNATEKNGGTITFDGVLIDFENIKGEAAKEGLNAFLIELKEALEPHDKSIYVAVHPVRKPGEAYYDAYDYRTIGSVADQVILMAHDYNAKRLTEDEMARGYYVTPLTPIDEIYFALKAITDPETGVEDSSKIMLQISFDSAQWKLKDGVIVNQYPYTPTYESIVKRMAEDVTMSYSTINENPYMTFQNEEDGTFNVLWYEDARSVMAKVDLAKMFGIEGISLWRMGNIPDYDEGTYDKDIHMDVWQQLLKDMGKN